MAEHTAPHRYPVGLVHFALALGGFAIGTTEFATMSLLPIFAKGLNIDAPTAGHVISAYALGVVVGAPLLAVAAARFDRRIVLVVLMALFAAGNALSALAPNFHSLLLFRFLAGLPHGAYFGIASLVAASLVPADKRTQAVGRIMLGLTVATIVGVPFANWLGQALGWRWGFGVVAVLALATVAMVLAFVPRQPADPEASPMGELQALKRGRVWLTLATGAIGFGGLFAVYTYLASTLTEVTGASATMIPVVLAVFGVGMTVGNLVIPRFADRALMPTAGLLLLWSAAALALYTVSTGHLWSILIAVFAVGLGGALGTVLQTRLMDVAQEAQGLAAALNHSAFNTANALGPWLGGMAIAAGYGWTSTGWVGAALALGGFLFWAISVVTSDGPVLRPAVAH
ncbi:MFS transporter [Sphingomonas prati]|uniref:DHA1 family inner membrane transport protein n=1 Tax=Sphingomonas prati TaxID=1843237 RepID=A0A7W9BU62_9SPHN|nr:MFS transporter [Sphingomonas prati]MBB5730168.1 DHA1 family inner membrane transport protein [Sphingomonas prati]GGE92030.1 MFS transporter [Sphingomonas prati]